MKETIDLILPLSAEFEGFRSKIYKYPVGFDTIGLGRNIEANPLSVEKKAKLNPDGSVSEAVAREWLREYLEKCYKELDETFSWFSKMDCVRKAALVDFDYNVGLGHSKPLKTPCDSLNVEIINKQQRICAKANGLFKQKDVELKSVLW